MVWVFTTEISLIRYAASIYGADIPIAAAGITLKLYGLFNAVVVGLSQGCQPILGYNYGAGRYSRVKKTLLYAIAVSIVLGSVIELVFQLFSVQCIQMFGNGDPLYLEFGSRFLRIYLLSLPVLGIQMVSSNYFAAIAQPLKGVLLSVETSDLLCPAGHPSSFCFWIDRDPVCRSSL